MPFTFSHPAAAVPFARCGLPLSALVVGSCAPDFPYFLQLSTASRFGHSLIGVFVFCVPASLVALWLWHRVLDLPLHALLPPRYRRIAPVDFRFAPPRRFLLIVCAIIVGALTHIVWDSFTHANGFTVKHWAWLQMPVADSRGTLRLYKVLQHTSSLFGALILMSMARCHLKKATVNENFVDANTPSHNAILVFLVVAFSLAFLRAALRQTSLPQPKIESFARDLTVSSIAFSVVVLLGWSVWWHVRNRANQP